MAPEQWADEEPDSRSDVYSLGVMLFQMLAGDVPFKGSSIPAIMKKHISDPVPTLGSMGVNASPELERAINRSLQKKPDNRTPSVEEFVNDLQHAIYPGSSMIHTTGPGRSLPVSSLKIQSKPPESAVFIDNVAVGRTADSGTLLLEGIQSGNHMLRVTHDGFYDWMGDVVCDGNPQEVYAELRAGVADSNAAIPKPMTTAIPVPGSSTMPNRGGFRSQDVMAQTVQQSFAPSAAQATVGGQEQKRGFFSPLVLGITGLLGLLVIGVIGVGAAYMLGYIGGPRQVGNPPTPTPAASPIPIKAELMSIPAGTFKMGRDDGRDNEKPAYSVDVKSFKMDKTEVTNAEYFAFITDTSYRPVPAHWVNSKPIPGTEMMPVRFVNIDDIKAFAAWRSKRDGVTYRLPTEQEWEYAARNGSKQNMYPWGDRFDAKCAVIDQTANDPVAVGTKSCANSWGVQDLIGNVFEWPGSEASLYPGSTGQILPRKEPYMMARGGSAFQKSSGPNAITATFRIDVPASRRSPELGFRLVRVQSTATAN